MSPEIGDSYDLLYCPSVTLFHEEDVYYDSDVQSFSNKANKLPSHYLIKESVTSFHRRGSVVIRSRERMIMRLHDYWLGAIIPNRPGPILKWTYST